MTTNRTRNRKAANRDYIGLYAVKTITRLFDQDDEMKKYKSD